MSAEGLVVTPSVTIRIDMLGSLIGERILCVGITVAVVVLASSGRAHGGGAVQQGACITVGSSGLVPKAIAIAIEPLRCIVGPKINAVRSAVTVGIDASERL